MASDDSAYLKVYDVRWNIIVCTSVPMPIKNFLHVAHNGSPLLFGVLNSVYKDLHLQIRNYGCMEVGNMGW